MTAQQSDLNFCSMFCPLVLNVCRDSIAEMKRLLFSCGDRFTLQTSPRKARIAGVAVQHKRHRTNLFSGGASEQVCQTKIGDRQLQHVGLSDVGRSRSQNSTIHMSAVCRVDTKTSPVWSHRQYQHPRPSSSAQCLLHPRHPHSNKTAIFRSSCRCPAGPFLPSGCKQKKKDKSQAAD